MNIIDMYMDALKRTLPPNKYRAFLMKMSQNETIKDSEELNIQVRFLEKVAAAQKRHSKHAIKNEEE